MREKTQQRGHVDYIDVVELVTVSTVQQQTVIDPAAKYAHRAKDFPVVL